MDHNKPVFKFQQISMMHNPLKEGLTLAIFGVNPMGISA